MKSKSDFSNIKPRKVQSQIKEIKLTFNVLVIGSSSYLNRDLKPITKKTNTNR